MLYYIAGGIVIAVLGYLLSLFLRGEIRLLVRVLRLGLGWGAIAVSVVMMLGGRMAIGSMLGIAGAGILSRGRLGPIDFGAGMSGPNNVSRVSSRYLDMELDHDSGTVSGTVREGPFARADLDDLDADQSWAFYSEIAADPDSRALYESWLNANREGWQDYFAEHYGFDGAGASGEAESEERSRTAGAPAPDPLREAYDILGLAPGASTDDVRAAHRTLMKKLHPDTGGSAFLAAKINAAKDTLLAALARH